MKTTIYVALLSVILFSCKNNENSKTYIPREITKNESFNIYSERKDTAIKVIQLNSDSKDSDKPKELFSVKFRDTTINIQTDKAEAASKIDKFSSATFVNTQRTALLVQAADSSGLVAPFYLIVNRDEQPEIVSLYKPSSGKEDIKYTKGLVKVGRDGYVVNNDFFITNVNAKVYVLKRQNDAERIQGEFFMKSPDKQTLVFLEQSSFYQVNYITGQTFTQALSPEARKSADIFTFIQQNYMWQKEKNGTSFLKAINGDRIVNIQEFK